MHLKNKQILVIDIGDYYLKGLIILFKELSLEVISGTRVLTQGFMSHITDKEKFTKSLIDLLDEIDYDNSEVIITLSSCTLNFKCLKNSLIVSDCLITEKHKMTLITEQKHDDFVLYNNQNFFLDKLLVNPINLMGKLLELQSHVFTTNYTTILNILNCFSQLNLKVLHISTIGAMQQIVNYKNYILVDGGCNNTRVIIKYQNEISFYQIGLGLNHLYKVTNPSLSFLTKNANVEYTRNFFYNLGDSIVKLDKTNINLPIIITGSFIDIYYLDSFWQLNFDRECIFLNMPFELNEMNSNYFSSIYGTAFHWHKNGCPII